MQDLVPSRMLVLMTDEPVAHVAVIADERPYVTPVSFVWLDDQLWFRTGPGTRLDAIRENPRVSAEVSRFDLNTGGWESVVIGGTARVVAEPDAEARIEKALRVKYRRITRSALEMPTDVIPHEGAVVAVTVEEMSGRASGSGVNDRDRPGRL